MPPAVRLSPLADSDKHLMPEIEVDDFIFGNMGATEDNPPMELPAERYQVKGFGDWGGYKQVLYCVGVRGVRGGGCADGGA